MIFARHIDEDLVKGTIPWEVYTPVHAKPEDIYFDKTTPDSFFNTDLQHILTKRNILTLIITGLQTDYCIDTTCISAFGKGIPVVLASDAHSTYDNSFMEAAKIIEYPNKIIGRWFGVLKKTDEIIEEMC